MSSEKNNLIVIYACEAFPKKVKRTLYLEGPKPMKFKKSWRRQALAFLETAEFEGHVFVPEPRPYNTVDYCQDFSTKQNQEDSSESKSEKILYNNINPDELLQWESMCLSACDIILFWFDRYDKSLCIELNDDFGYYKDTGRVLVVGISKRSVRVNYQKKWVLAHDIPLFNDLKICIHKCMSLFSMMQETFAIYNIDLERCGALARIPAYIYSWKPFQQWVLNSVVTQNKIIDCTFIQCDRVQMFTNFFHGSSSLTKSNNNNSYIKMENKFPKIINVKVRVAMEFFMGPKYVREQIVNFQLPQVYIFGYYLPHHLKNHYDIRIVLKYYFMCSMNSITGTDPCLQLVHLTLDEEVLRSAKTGLSCSGDLLARIWQESTGLWIADKNRFKKLQIQGSEIQNDVTLGTRRSILYTIRLDNKEHEELIKEGSLEDRHVVMQEYSLLKYSQLDFKTIGMIELAIHNLSFGIKKELKDQKKNGINLTTASSSNSNNSSSSSSDDD